MKKLILGLVVVATVLTGCGNKDVFQMDYTFKKAMVRLPNGEVITGEVEEWSSYQSKSIFKVKFKDGRQYLGSAEDIILYNEK